ncbi:MAG TPA: ABC transporter substrate-binding protein/permease [Candidatus Polarisedimenticolia bacterium]|nr:ABC transporter substrate-binding protein/permease [Candidatus Polarisedimenticolia bacterium]
MPRFRSRPASFLALAVALVFLPPALAAARAVGGGPGKALPSRPPGAALRWAADAEGGAPYIFKDPKNPDRNVGFEVDLIEALSRDLKRPITFVQYDYKSLIPGIQRGDFDFAMNGLEVTGDRKTRVRFSRPYYVFRLQLVVRATDHRFESLEACKAAGCLVGTLEDTAAERLLDRMGIAKKVYDGQVEPYRDLTLLRLDAVLLDLPIAIYYARPNPLLRFAGDPVDKGYYSIACRLGDEGLATELDGALDRLLQSGEVRRLYEKWGIWNDDQKELAGAGIEDIITESRRLWTFDRYAPLLVQGAWLTVRLSVTSFLLAILLALPVALARLYGAAPLRWLATGYVEFFRGIPVLLLLYFLYYGLADLAIAWDLGFLKLAPLEAAILGLGLNYSSYEAEIYRAGIGSIPVGQWEAAASLAMPRTLTFRRIILPQAIRVILPPMTNDFVALFKDTSIVSMIAVVELSKQYQILSKSSMKYLEIGLLTAVLYLIMSVPLGALSRRLEKRWGKGIL